MSAIVMLIEQVVTRQKRGLNLGGTRPDAGVSSRMQSSATNSLRKTGCPPRACLTTINPISGSRAPGYGSRLFVIGGQDKTLPQLPKHQQRSKYHERHSTREVHHSRIVLLAAIEAHALG